MSENKLEVGSYFRIDNKDIGIRAMWLDLDDYVCQSCRVPDDNSE